MFYHIPAPKRRIQMAQDTNKLRILDPLPFILRRDV